MASPRERFHLTHCNGSQTSLPPSGASTPLPAQLRSQLAATTSYDGCMVSQSPVHHFRLTLPDGSIAEGTITAPGTAAPTLQPPSLAASSDNLPNHSLPAALVAAALDDLASRPDQSNLPFIHVTSPDDDSDDREPLIAAEAGHARYVNLGEINDTPETRLDRHGNPIQSWQALISQKGAAFVNSTLQTGRYIITHPFSLGLSIVTASPTALNALASPSGKSPGDLNAQWWPEMSNLQRAHSIASGTSGLLINTIMSALFLPTALETFRRNIGHVFDSLEDFLDNTFAIILAIGGALAAAAIGYSAFLFLPFGAVTAIIPALLAFGVTLAQRYVGIKNIFRRFRNLFNKDAKTQTELADIAKHVKHAHLEEIDARLKVALASILASPGRSQDQPLTEQDYEKLMVELASILHTLKEAHPDLINDKTSLEYLHQYIGIVFDITFAALVIFPPSFLVHMQKGFDGVNTIAKLATQNPLPNMSTLLKCLIGLDPALASGLLYANQALNLRSTLIDTVFYLYQHPTSIPQALVLLTANYFASEGMKNVANGLVANPDNLFGLKPESIPSQLLVSGTQAGGAVVNTTATLAKAFQKPMPVAKDVGLKDVIEYAEDIQRYVICRDTGRSLRQDLSIFQKPKNSDSHRHEHPTQRSSVPFIS